MGVHPNILPGLGTLIMSNDHLLVSLAFLCRNRATGLQTYAVNILQHLSFDLTLLMPPWVDMFPTHRTLPVHDGMSSDDGIKGHFRRLAWT